MSEYEAAEREMDHMQAEIDQLRAGLDNVYADSARLDKLERMVRNTDRDTLSEWMWELTEHPRSVRAAIDAVEEAKP